MDVIEYSVGTNVSEANEVTADANYLELRIPVTAHAGPNFSLSAISKVRTNNLAGVVFTKVNNEIKAGGARGSLFLDNCYKESDALIAAVRANASLFQSKHFPAADLAVAGDGPIIKQKIDFPPFSTNPMPTTPSGSHELERIIVFTTPEGDLACGSPVA